MDGDELQLGAARVRHDIGRYVCFQQRWLGEACAADALREALVADLLQTQRGPDGAVDVLTLWSRLAPLVPTEAFTDSAPRAAFDAAIAALAPWIERLVADDLPDDDLAHAAAAARRVADAATALHRAAKEQTQHG